MELEVKLNKPKNDEEEVFEAFCADPQKKIIADMVAELWKAGTWSGDALDSVRKYMSDNNIVVMDDVLFIVFHQIYGNDVVASTFGQSITNQLWFLFNNEKTKHKFRRTDIGNAKLFAEIYKDKAAYSPEIKSWLHYDGQRWVIDLEGKLTMTQCKDLGEALLIHAKTIDDEAERESFIKWAAKWQNRATREIILKDASDLMLVKMSQFDTNPNYLNVQNGTLDLKTFKLRKQRASDYLMKMANVYYEPGAECERFNQFINEIMCDDNEKIKYIQKAFGYSLTGSVSEECLFIAYGPTSRNGKGTLFETISYLLGDYACAIQPELLSALKNRDATKANEPLCKLQGARFAVLNEAEKNMIFASALLKTLTGGDRITARPNYGHQYEYIPSHKFWLGTNYLPSVNDSTVFASERIKVIPFERHFEYNERDLNLKTKFKEENVQSAILNWMIEGLKLFKEEGLKTPDCIKNATDDYAKESDKIALFIESELIKGYSNGQPLEARTQAVYDYYKAWCNDNGYQGVVNSKNFKGELMRHGLNIKQKRPIGENTPTQMIIGHALRNTQNVDFVADNSIDF